MKCLKRRDRYTQTNDISFVGVMDTLLMMVNTSKMYFFAALIFLVFATLTNVFQIRCLNLLYEKIGEGNFDRIFIYFFIMTGVVLIISDIMNAISNYILDVQRVKAQKGYVKKLFDKVCNMEPLQLQNPEILQLIDTAKENKEAAVDYLIHAEVIFGNHFVYLGFMTALVYSIHPYLALAIIATYIPAILTFFLKRKVVFEGESKYAADRRRMNTFYSYVTDKRFFKETRFLHIEGKWKEKYNDSSAEFKRKRLKNIRIKGYFDILCNVFYVIGFAIVLAVIFVLVSNKEISTAGIATVLMVVISVYDNMNEMVNGHISEMIGRSNGLYAIGVLDKLKAKYGNNELAGEGFAIKAENLCFSYPLADAPSIKNINIDIKSGELIAIVGENGAGKSTLSKVLSGTYAKTGGKLFYNMIDSDELDRRTVIDRVSCVFQDFCKYPMSVKDNVLISDIGYADCDDNSISNERVSKFLEISGIREKVELLPERENTLLSKEFGGIELSGGEWQRIAIARSINKKSDLLIFDEPTAAIDPIEEVEIIKKLMTICRGKTALFVTHRIGAAKFADRIVVVKDGTICEQGTHNELMKKKAEYYRLYKSQSKWYEMKNEI